MKRKNLAALAAMMVCMTAGCAGNTNSPALQAAPAPSASVAETTMAEPQSEQENSSSGAMETSAVAETAMQSGSGTIAQVHPNQTQTVMETAPGSISMETAKSIAMKDAGISGESVSYSSAKLDWVDGRQVYDVDFFSVGIEYEYEILASDGTILKKKQDAEWGKNSGTPAGHVAGQPNAAAGQSGAAQGATGYLTMEQGRQKVAERIPGVDPANVYIKEDYDDGRLKYEGEVYYNQTKYEFELDAATGAFTDWEEEKGR